MVKHCIKLGLMSLTIQCVQYKSNVSSTQMWMWWFMTIQHWYFPPLTTQYEQSVSLTLHLRWGCVCLQCPVWVVVVGGAACPLGVMMQSNAAGEDSQQLYHTLSVQLDKNTGHVKIKWSTSLITNAKLRYYHYHPMCVIVCCLAQL